MRPRERRTDIRGTAFKAALLLLAAPMLLGSVGRLNNMEDRLLASHNRERATAGVEPLEWDDALAADAAKWAKHLTGVGHLVHYPDNPADPDPQGENLWAGTRGYYGLESMVGLWIVEKKNFKQGVFPANTTTGNLEDVGHYTQLMWRSTRKMGCAVAQGRGDDFLVCRYSEGGNVIGERPF